MLFIRKLPTESPAPFRLPCKSWFGILNNVPIFEVKLAVPFLRGGGSLL